MHKNSTEPILLHKLFELLERHRWVFGQERVYWRNVGMVVGELFNFGRHTVTQMLLSLGVLDGDWSAWYRMFSRGRYREACMSRVMLKETLQEVPEAEPYVLGVDGVQIPPQQPEDARDKLVESATDAGIQSGHPPRPAFLARELADTTGQRLQPCHSAAFPACFSTEGKRCQGCTATGVGNWPDLCPMGARWAGRTRASRPTGFGTGRWFLRYTEFLVRLARTGHPGRSNGSQPGLVLAARATPWQPVMAKKHPIQPNGCTRVSPGTNGTFLSAAS